MSKAGKIALSIFAFYLIFGLNVMFGAGQRFIAPHILDDLIILGVSIYFATQLDSWRERIYPLVFALFGFIGFLSAPHAAMLFDELVDMQRFATFINENHKTILLFYACSFILLILSGIPVSVHYAKKHGLVRALFILFAISLLLLLPLSLLLEWDLILFAGSMFCISGIIIARNETQYTLSKAHYILLMSFFITSMLAVLEYISISGLISL